MLPLRWFTIPAIAGGPIIASVIAAMDTSATGNTDPSTVIDGMGGPMRGPITGEDTPTGLVPGIRTGTFSPVTTITAGIIAWNRGTTEAAKETDISGIYDG